MNKEIVIGYKLLNIALIKKDFIKNMPNCSYECYLTELLNESTYFLNKFGEKVTLTKNQSNGECDAISKKYKLDYKLLFFELLIEESVANSPKQLIDKNGVHCMGFSEKSIDLSCIDNLHNELLNKDILSDTYQNKRNNKIIKSIKSCRTIMGTDKNILLYYPIELIINIDEYNQETINDMEIVYIKETLLKWFKVIIEYRENKVKDKDTYFVTIYKNHFLIFEIKYSKINYIENISLEKIPTYKEIESTCKVEFI